MRHILVWSLISSTYKPDKENTTTNVLDTLQYLVCAVWSGFRAGMFNPELARYGYTIPKGMIPKSRESINDYDVQTLMQYSLMLKYADDKELTSSFLVRLVGDVYAEQFGLNLFSHIMMFLKKKKEKKNK